MHPVFEIDEKVRSYLNREITLDDLGAWLSDAKGPLLALPAEHPAGELITIVELGLIELQQGKMTERSFRRYVKENFDSRTRIVIEGNPELVLSGTTTLTSFVDPSSGYRSSSTTVFRSKQADTLA